MPWQGNSKEKSIVQKQEGQRRHDREGDTGNLEPNMDSSVNSFVA